MSLTGFADQFNESEYPIEPERRMTQRVRCPHITPGYELGMLAADVSLSLTATIKRTLREVREGPICDMPMRMAG
jgi:hypothetical protein